MHLLLLDSSYRISIIKKEMSNMVCFCGYPSKKNVKSFLIQFKLVKEWAADVWNAYAVNHDLAKNWIKVAMT